MTMTDMAQRRDPAWYTPTDLPTELSESDTSISNGLGVGAPGKVGLLEMGLDRCAGMTRVRRQFQQSPLYTYRPMYLDPCRPDMAFVVVMQSGDGFVQGDRCRIDIDCGPGAAAHVTTQAATNVFATRQNFASQLVYLRSGRGAVLEYLPEPVVPFRGSRFFQRTCLTADSNSTMIVGETLLPGRVARNEGHDYDVFRAETELRDPDQKLLFADVLHFEPTGGQRASPIDPLTGQDVIATLYVITARTDPADMVAVLRVALSGCADVLAGVSELPNRCGAIVRLLGPDSRTVRAAMAIAWNAGRLASLGAPAPNLRKG